jgi:NAD-dependent dihydropyrimidine dehydrogenase PreA subunit
MLKRNIIRIDEEKCDGCGLCVPACEEGAIRIIEGKARLVSEIYCDGLGACLGQCPQGAISVEEREAEPFDPEAVADHLRKPSIEKSPLPPVAESSGCPGSMLRRLPQVSPMPKPHVDWEDPEQTTTPESKLGHWPVQLALLPPVGPIWEDADVLIAADCVPFAMPDFHNRLLAGKTVAVGCPKLDNLAAYTEKLTEIFAHNSIRSVTVAHMEVPCCTGILIATKQALQRSGSSDIELHDVVVGIRGSVLEGAPCR